MLSLLDSISHLVISCPFFFLSFFSFFFSLPSFFPAFVWSKLHHLSLGKKDVISFFSGLTLSPTLYLILLLFLGPLSLKQEKERRSWNTRWLFTCMMLFTLLSQLFNDFCQADTQISAWSLQFGTSLSSSTATAEDSHHSLKEAMLYLANIFLFPLNFYSRDTGCTGSFFAKMT